MSDYNDFTWPLFLVLVTEAAPPLDSACALVLLSLFLVTVSFGWINL